MSNVQQAMEGRHLTVEVRGVPFVVRRYDTLMALKIHGSGVFGLIEGAEAAARGEDGKRTVSPQDATTYLDLIRKHLELGMVSPRLGESTDADADTISMDDLGDDVFTLMSAIRGSAPDPANFTPPSPATEGEK